MKCIESDETLKSFSRLDELLDLMVQSGCDLIAKRHSIDAMQVDCIQAILEAIMVFDALHKRKLFLHSFGEGLEVFGVLSSAFESKGILPPEDVLKILTLKAAVDNMFDRETRVYHFFMKQCTVKRKYKVQ